MRGHLCPECLLLVRANEGRTTGMRLGIEGLLLAPLCAVALDRGDADAEVPGHRVLVLVAFDRGHDLGSQVR
jgi:hypothetical protein